MAKIYPGNYNNLLSAYSRSVTNRVTGATEVISGPTGVVTIPGQVAYHVLAYAEVPLVGATVLPLIIPSPDAYKTSTGRLDITPVVIPVGAVVTSVGIRLDGVANLTTGHSLKIASAVGAATSTIITSAFSSPLLPVSSGGIIAAGQAKKINYTGNVVLNSAYTASVYTVDASGTATGGSITRANLPLVDKPVIIAEIVYILPDDIAGPEMIGLQPSGINYATVL